VAVASKTTGEGVWRGGSPLYRPLPVPWPYAKAIFLSSHLFTGVL